METKNRKSIRRNKKLEMRNEKLKKRIELAKKSGDKKLAKILKKQLVEIPELHNEETSLNANNQDALMNTIDKLIDAKKKGNKSKIEKYNKKLRKLKKQ